MKVVQSSLQSSSDNVNLVSNTPKQVNAKGLINEMAMPLIRFNTPRIILVENSLSFRRGTIGIWPWIRAIAAGEPDRPILIIFRFQHGVV